MQKDQKFKLEVSSKVEVNSQCSCLECDSASCFVKRRAKEHCTCARLAASELHNHSSPTSILVTETKHSISKPSIQPQEKIVPDLKKKQIKSSISEVTQQIISEFMKESNKDIIPESTTTLFKISNTSFSQRQGNSKITAGFNKDSCEESRKDKGSNVYCYRKKAYREGSENVNQPKDGACQNMSAAVGHSMLHQEQQAPIPKEKISSAMVNLSAVDIYNKIKEAYKACSCDVCKCVVGKSLQNKFCECKPCECHDCANLSECMLKYIGTEVIQKHDEKCFCLLCDKKSCKVLEDSERKLNNHVKLQDYYGHQECSKLGKCGKDCDCKRCECIKCKSRLMHRTLIVAPVGGELQPHNGCQCAPCECFECTHRYGVNNNGQHEISTSVNRHPNCHCEVCDNEACTPDNNQSCRCVRQNKVMSKPVERDLQNYDIHTAHVTYNNKEICAGNFETLAMFAALPSSYTKRFDKIKQCNCNPCECLNCEYFDRINSQDLLQSHQLDRDLHGKIKYCKPEVLEQFKLEDRRVFDQCSCTDCHNIGVKNEKAPKNLNKKCSSNHICDCNICEMGECENTETEYFKYRRENASIDFITLMKSRRQTRLRNIDPLIESCIDTLQLNKKIFQQHELAFHASKSSTSIDNFDESQHPPYRQVCYGSHRIFCSNFENDSVVHEHISERANKLDLIRHSKQKLNSNISLLSSKSYVKESESVTPVTSKLKSRESSCNSSGYDYPDYLAHFPKLTIKTCLEDVMQCNLRNNEVFNMGSKHNNVPNSSHFNLRDRKSFQSQPILSARSSKTTKVNRKASQTFYIPNYVNQIRKLTKETRKTYNPLSKCKVSSEKNIDKFKTDSASTSTTNTSAKVTFNEEYIRVQKALQDAREYSLHLISLFEKYEKANKEFQSITERIKNSNNSIDRNIITLEEVPTKDSECTFASAFDEIDTINKQENYIDNRDNINFSEKSVNILKKEIFADHDGGNQDYAFIDTNYTTTEEKDTKNVNKQKMSINKKLDKRHIQVTERIQDVVTPQRCISQSSKIEDKPGVFLLKNDSDILLITDSQSSLGNHRDFQESLNNKVINSQNTDEYCHDKSNIGKDDNIKAVDERKSITVKRDFYHISSTKLIENTDLSTKCTTELINLSKSKSAVKTITESSKIIAKNLHSPLLDLNINSDNLKHEGIKITLPPPHESDGKAATEVISQQPVDKHATYVNKSKSLKSNTIVNKTTESSKLLLENLDNDKNSGKVEHEDIVPPPHETVEKAATEVISQQPVDEHYVNKSKALEIVQTEVKRILDLPFLQVVKDQKVVLIDGRFVQRTNPSRRMAVLCCLPPAEKILLTVRTVVAIPVSDHYPAVTLVYHTKMKSERFMQSRNSFM